MDEELLVAARMEELLVAGALYPHAHLRLQVVVQGA
jgi:hypothetical protein